MDFLDIPNFAGIDRAQFAFGAKTVNPVSAPAPVVDGQYSNFAQMPKCKDGYVAVWACDKDHNCAWKCVPYEDA